MFRRREAEPAEPPEPRGARAADPSDDAVRPGAKGRPTPKRREAEQHRRQRVRPPKDRKEALRHARAAAREERMRTRRALVSGDDRYLPPRDRGPVRGYVRDFVDARRCAAEYFLPVALLVFVLNLTGNPRILYFVTLLWLAMLLLIVVDSTLLIRRLKAALRAKFPGDDLRGVTSYALLRSTQIRRLRLPKPRVKPGATI